MDNILVSIVIPCYNVQRFIGQLFSNLEKQTYKKFEVIFINDGSTDKTYDYLVAHQRITTCKTHIINKDNEGVSRARNIGIELAKGKYITFLDADDAYHEKFLEILINSINQSSADVAYCRTSRDYKTVASYKFHELQYDIHNQEDTMSNLLYHMGEFAFCCFLYRRDILLDKSIFFEENTKYGEDREFNWKYLCHCTRACYIDAPLYWYRINNESATQSKASWRNTDVLYAVMRIQNYLLENDISFREQFNSYMFPRAVWSVAKSFALSQDYSLFQRLETEFDVRTCMIKTSNDANIVVAVLSRIYRIYPDLFYYFLAIYSKIKLINL